MVDRQAAHWQFGQHRFDPKTGKLDQGERSTILLPKDCLVLEALLARSCELVSKDELHRQCWPQQSAVGGDVLKSCIRRLRQALGDDFRNPLYIETFGRRGYRFLLAAKILGKQSQPVSAAPAISADFVGRQDELARLVELHGRVRAGGFGLLIVSGEAGIGKTTLIENFAKELGPFQDTILLQGQCQDSHGPAEAYHPLLSALGLLADRLPRAAFAELLRTIAPMWLVQLPWLVEGGHHLDLLAELQGTSGQRMQRELLALLGKVCQRQTLVIVLEDMHWSDTATVDLLGLMARSRPQPERLLVIATCRIHENPDHPFHLLLDDLDGRELCTHIHLPPLPEREIESYLAARFPGQARPAGLASWLREFSGGNPLLFKAMVDQGLRKGWLQVNDRLTWQPPDAGAVTKMAPRNLRYLVESRVNQLSIAEKECLETASVAGMHFSTRLLAGAGETEIESEVLCERLVRTTGFLARALVHCDGGGRQSPGFSFRHALYQRLIQEGIPRLRRQHLHLTVGERLEALSAQASSEVALQLAIHFEFAGRPLRAAFFRQQVALSSLLRHAYREVIEHAERGLALLAGLPPDPDKDELELNLLLPLGSGYLATKGYASPEVERCFARAFVLSGKSTSTCQMVVLFSLGIYWMVRGDFPRMYEVVENLAAHSHQTKLARDCVGAYALSSIYHFYRGNFAESYRAHQSCEKNFQPSPPGEIALLSGIEPRISSAGHAALSSWLMGYPERAEREMNAITKQAREHYGQFTQIWCICYLGWLYLCLGYPEKAKECSRLSHRLSLANGVEYWLGHSSILLGWAEGISGDYDTGIRRIEENIVAHRNSGAGFVDSFFLSLLADVHNASGRQDAALESIDEAILLGSRIGEEWWLAEMFRRRGDTLAASAARADGHGKQLLSAAEESYRNALAVAGQQQAKSLQLRAAIGLAALLLKTNRAAEGLALLKPLYSWFTEGFATPDLQSAGWLIQTLSST